MNTAADNLEVNDALETAVSEETAADTRSGLLPFGFSQAKQVVLEPSEDGLTLSYVGQLDTETLLEVRRTAGANFALEQVDEITFQTRLSGAYQRNQNQAAQMAEDLSSDVDLARLVDEIPALFIDAVVRRRQGAKEGPCVFKGRQRHRGAGVGGWEL